ncbi:MoxR-like ATPase [Malaciobacter marinus]|jgi:MoxR-like ATPase|uniref:MoxR family ATPase n=1 Tax=Malaciobacter marinus TaxID=505249 RepID=A0A347TII7_9BACT|nr:MoxR family ATPase [Malaciobacter marinus]AXX86415.1 MoxR-like ATPase [Malaciobacter marinus]PHO12393.1 MoxR family ATPase [Malaciobacter marinus]PHO15495.1 MoxR family ATPase [Malaciobacter marinus]
MNSFKTIMQIKNELAKKIVGQEEMIDALLIGLLTNGHILLEGVPGLAKTTTVNSLAKVINVDFKRVQFTPDLLPSDIIGAQIYDMKTGEFKIKKGPIFTNLLLADEINRAPAKVQSALLEVMQERQVTIAENSFKIDKPFLVLATQNPIEQEGAYTLPEAQLDRFMFKIVVSYNTKEQEYEIAKMASSNEKINLEKIITKEELFKLKDEILNVHIDKELEEYIVDIICATRDPKSYGLEELSEQIEFGASPRATIDMFKAVKAQAYLRGNDYVSPIDIALLVKNILRHRIILSYEAQAQDINVDDVIDKIVEKINIP